MPAMWTTWTLYTSQKLQCQLRTSNMPANNSCFLIQMYNNMSAQQHTHTLSHTDAPGISTARAGLVFKEVQVYREHRNILLYLPKQCVTGGSRASPHYALRGVRGMFISPVALVTQNMQRAHARTDRRKWLLMFSCDVSEATMHGKIHQYCTSNTECDCILPHVAPFFTWCAQQCLP